MLARNSFEEIPRGSYVIKNGCCGAKQSGFGCRPWAKVIIDIPIEAWANASAIQKEIKTVRELLKSGQFFETKLTNDCDGLRANVK